MAALQALTMHKAFTKAKVKAKCTSVGAKSGSKNAIQKYYPDNNGFLGKPKTSVLPKGARFDRYGYPGGKYGAPVGTPVQMRSLPPGGANKPYAVYEFLKPYKSQIGKTAPWFGEFGQGTQYYFDDTIKYMLDNGIIKQLP